MEVNLGLGGGDEPPNHMHRPWQCRAVPPGDDEQQRAEVVLDLLIGCVVSRVRSNLDFLLLFLNYN